MPRLTSLLLVEERLLEAEYFIKRLDRQKSSIRFGYELNAFLSAARSVTFLLQKELADVPGFEAWWAGQRALLAQDAAARFFLELRNFSQKQGRVSLVGARIGRRGSRRWTYRFAGTAERVPVGLLHRDAVDCCREHLRKLAALVLSCAGKFPFHTCPKRALTPEGLDALGIRIEEVEETLGYPRGWTKCFDGPAVDRLRALRRHVDGVNFDEIRRLSRLRLRRPASTRSPDTAFGASLLHSLVENIEKAREVGDPGHPIAAMIAKQLVGGPRKR